VSPDYAYLAGLAYRGVNATQSELDGWFGEGVAVDNSEVVREWKRNERDSEVSFKLISFPTRGNFSYVSIRGTSNNWDMLTDAQLWSAAFLMQGLRELLPLGKVWTPIIDQLVNVMTTLESKSINRVSFYKDTTAFVKSLQKQVPLTYSGLGVTGHSLGGGLAIITGAQTGVPAVGLSGPNAMLSRQTFDPPVSATALDSLTFNIIPERDIVPMIDIPAQSFQHIRCLTDLTDVVGCHDSTRSLCEIMYTCGSRDRPVLCECVKLYHYPEPTPKAGVNVSFAEFCGI
jgi:lipase ATG15